MKPAPVTRWDLDRWAGIERRVPRTARLLEKAHTLPHVGDLVRALFLDALDKASEDGLSVGYVAHELGISRRTCWRWVRELESEAATVPDCPLNNGQESENAGRNGTRRR